MSGEVKRFHLRNTHPNARKIEFRKAHQHWKIRHKQAQRGRWM